jgi:hypothetical protein
MSYLLVYRFFRELNPVKNEIFCQMFVAEIVRIKIFKIFKKLSKKMLTPDKLSFTFYKT